MRSSIQAANKQTKIFNETNANIARALQSVFQIIGMKETNIPKDVPQLVSDIKTDLGRFTIDEFIMAFKLFAKGVMDYRLKDQTSVQSFSYIFMENVLQSYARFRVKYMDSNYFKAYDPTPEEIEEIHRKATINKFNHYKKTSEIQDPGNPSFNWLYQKRILKYTEEDYLDFGQKAKSRLKNAARNKAAAGMLKSKLTTVLESYENGNNIKSEAKRLVLADFFQSLIDNNQHIEQVI